MKEENKLTLRAIVLEKHKACLPGAIIEQAFLNPGDHLVFARFQPGDSFVIVYSDQKNSIDSRAILASFIELKELKSNQGQVHKLVFKAKSYFDVDDIGLIAFDEKNAKNPFKFYKQTDYERIAKKYDLSAISFGVIGVRDELKVFLHLSENEFERDLLRFYDIFRSLKNPIERDAENSKSFESVFFNNQAHSDLSATLNYIDDLQDKYSEFHPKKHQFERVQEFILTTVSHFNNSYFDREMMFDDFGIAELQEIVRRITEFLGVSAGISKQVQENMNKKVSNQHKEFIIREKVKILQEELANINVPIIEDEYSNALRDKTKAQMFPESVKKLIAEENKRSSEMMPASPEASISKTFVATLKKLPWRKTQKEFLDIKHARSVLEKYHYGLDKVKERIIEYIAVIINQKNQEKKSAKKLKLDNELEIDLNLFKEDNKKKEEFNNVPIICLVGPPGTGKTSLSKAIAESLQRKFVKISLGGVHDESEIRGHRRTYVGAMPGKIIKGILKADVSNPVILLDEIDKMASTNKGDPASAMLEVLDPEQNSKFQDHYLEHEYDLSKAIFIATANYYESIPHALIDRVEIIELSSYTLTEKINIARKHLLPKVTQQVALPDDYLKLSDETLKYIIQHYTSEAGVRGLKRILDKIARKLTVKLLETNKKDWPKEYQVEIKELDDLLGVVIYKKDTETEEEKPGIVNGLAYTSTGGSTLQIEVNIFPGKEEIKITGSLKEVMKESAQISVSYVRSNAEKFGIKNFDFDKHTIHIHVPEGAVPKDGPSAGVTFTTALISALKKLPVAPIYGMTGEITLRGKVLDIGGLKEKSFAANQKNIKKVFIPHGNINNLRDIPSEIKSTLTYIPVKNYEEIYNVIFNNKKPLKVIKE
ncbi:endopeptidase La [Mycoplasmopsis bovirhinis]|nr:endopeptidase La [Mycoplasmopsis bovirhinis]BBA22552.1 endopeptidase La [Mycoplasmopsis bovirhinis]